jgi:hypothetical protein
MLVRMFAFFFLLHILCTYSAYLLINIWPFVALVSRINPQNQFDTQDNEAFTYSTTARSCYMFKFLELVLECKHYPSFSLNYFVTTQSAFINADKLFEIKYSSLSLNSVCYWIYHLSTSLRRSFWIPASLCHPPQQHRANSCTTSWRRRSPLTTLHTLLRWLTSSDCPLHGQGTTMWPTSAKEGKNHHPLFRRGG